MVASAAIPIDSAKYGPWAVIAGGSEGIGPCLAEHLAASGINLVLLARKPEPLAEVADRVRERHGVAVRTLAVDLTSETMLDAISEATDDLEVGLLIYNAGSSDRTGFFVDWALADVQRVIRLNTLGPATLVHHFGQRMAKRGRGGLVTMGSLAGNAGSPTVVPYSGAKAFEQVFAEGLWWEMKQRGVDVLHVVVGSTETPAMARLGIVHRANEADQPEAVARVALENLANGPVIPVPSIAERYLALASPDRRGAVENIGAMVMANTEGTWEEAK